MLPLRRDSLIVGISRDHLEWLRCHGVVAQKVVAQGLEMLAGSPLQGDAWQKQIFARMHECAACTEWQNADVTVILSSELVRYLAFVAPKNIRRSTELHVYAQQQFTQVYGDVAQHWQIRLSPSKKSAYLACAFDLQWLEELRAIFQNKQHLISIQPAFMASFNLYRKTLPNKGVGWYVCYENQQFTYALFGDDQWQYVQTRRGNQVMDLLQWLERENIAGRLAQPCREIWLSNAVPYVPGDTAYNFHVLPHHSPQKIDSMQYTLASLGVS